jgi:hypothetical protein
MNIFLAFDAKKSKEHGYSDREEKNEQKRIKKKKKKKSTEELAITE